MITNARFPFHSVPAGDRMISNILRAPLFSKYVIAMDAISVPSALLEPSEESGLLMLPCIVCTSAECVRVTPRMTYTSY